MTTLILKRASASRLSFMASSLAFGLLLFGTLPTAAQKIYYEAPFGEAPFAPGKGTWTIRKDLTLPTANKPALLPYKELINEGLPGVDQKYLGLGRAFGLECSPHICAPTFLSLILWFAPKATANLKLIFETTAPLFHALGMGGGPIWIGTPRNGPDYHVYPDNANYARVWNTRTPHQEQYVGRGPTSLA
jgi:hypothetical protein